MVNNTSTFRRNARRGAAALVIGGAAAGALATAPANADSLDWDAVAQCESGGDWSTSTGNGFSGGLQFTPSTWSSFGGQGDPQNASKEQQIQVAERVLAEQGPGAWPVCSQQAGSGDSGSGQQEQAQPQQDVQAQSQDVQEFQAPAEQAQPEQAPVEQAPVEQAQPEQAPVEQAQPEVQQVPEQQTYEAPAQEQVAAPVQSSAATHTVSVGETLKSIADQYGVSVDALVQANGSVVTNPDLIFPGQTLEIPAA
ncbi:LysM peptidoglycan-binding domain-containing protein [Kocuria koreensis]|uniref:LysM peptidoglycan-binding domain-containing protein n=1 Tax=Rothia koreensis TaxID=592378 RepID=A0A7K1LIH7_9MICC|nr:LysM peptidoglycan-binding domain-containing protein [Rothia koreensis]